MIRPCLLLALSVAAQVPGANKPWIFFDLGKTLVDHTPQYADMKFLPGAADYLDVLRKDGYRLGLLVNWPEEEGSSDEEKLHLLKAFLQTRWVDTRPFDWSLFGAVFFPPRNLYYKPHAYLFEKASDHARPCPALYQGEQTDEIQAARAADLKAHRVDYFPPAGKPLIPLLPLGEVDAWRRHTVINLFGC